MIESVLEGVGRRTRAGGVFRAWRRGRWFGDDARASRRAPRRSPERERFYFRENATGIEKRHSQGRLGSPLLWSFSTETSAPTDADEKLTPPFFLRRVSNDASWVFFRTRCRFPTEKLVFRLSTRSCDETDSPYETFSQSKARVFSTPSQRLSLRKRRFTARARVSGTEKRPIRRLPATFGSAYSDTHDGRYHHLRPHCGEGPRGHAPHARHRARRGRACRVHLRRLLRRPQDDDRRFREGRSRAADRRRSQVPRVVRAATRQSTRHPASRTRARPFFARARDAADRSHRVLVHGKKHVPSGQVSRARAREDDT